MSDKSSKRKLTDPWRSIHVVIWVVGLYILLTRGWIFPGIFVLIAISAIFEAFLRRYAPGAYEPETPPQPAPTAEPPAPIPPVVTTYTPIQEHRFDLLPQVCPGCNAPVRGHEVRWTGVQSANCPYCGTNLPMNKA